MVHFVFWYGAFRKPKEPISHDHRFFSPFWWRNDRCGKGSLTHRDRVAIGLLLSILRILFVKIFYYEKRMNIQFRTRKPWYDDIWTSRHAHAVNKATHAIGKQKILLTACRKDSNNMMYWMKIRVYQAETCSVFMKNVLRIRHGHAAHSSRHTALP